MSKSLHVVFQQSAHIKDVAFITRDKNEVDIFFMRPSRQKSFFHVEVFDKEKIKLFERDFMDRFCEIEGMSCMLQHEHEDMSNSIPGLVDALADHIRLITENMQYLQLSNNEEHAILEMLKIYYTLVKSEYDCENDEEIFDMELLMDRYLCELGV